MHELRKVHRRVPHESLEPIELFFGHFSNSSVKSLEAISGVSERLLVPSPLLERKFSPRRPYVIPFDDAKLAKDVYMKKSFKRPRTGRNALGIRWRG